MAVAVSLEVVVEVLPVETIGACVAVAAEELQVKVDADLGVCTRQAQLPGVVEVEGVLRSSDGVDGLRYARRLVEAADAVAQAQPFLAGTGCGLDAGLLPLGAGRLVAVAQTSNAASFPLATGSMVHPANWVASITVAL